ncbi:DUF3135 domain-containing protein [Marinobacter nanhaiticus]|nr:DUF3135 domain-containing protein [Marinobacter nanhaiticus]
MISSNSSGTVLVNRIQERKNVMDMPTFDELKDLAQRDPERFEIVRAALISECIRQSAARNQQRLRGLQFVIDARRRIAGSPMKALLDLQTLMYDSLLALQQALVDQQPRAVAATARVLPFRRSASFSDD